LLKSLTDTDPGVRRAVVQALGALGSTTVTQDVLDALLKSLADSEVGMRRTAAEALGTLGSTAAAPNIFAALINSLTYSEADVRRAADQALQNLSAYVRPQDRPQVVKLFLPLIYHSDEICRETVYVGLRNLLAAEPR